MNSLNDPFTLTPEILQGMDGCNSIPKSVAHLRANPDSLWDPGDGVDACIITAQKEGATTTQNVMDNLRYQRDQLSILIRNLESLPE